MNEDFDKDEIDLVEQGKLSCTPPYYILKGYATCWNCAGEFPVAGVVAATEVEPGFLETVYLRSIKELPDELLQEIQRFAPGYHTGFSGSTGSEYFVNTCPHCGKITGDHFLFCEPDSPFGVSQDLSVLLHRTSFQEPMVISASWGMRGGLP